MDLLSSSLQKYLLTIYKLYLENEAVYQIDVAIELGYSKPSVSRAIHLLIEKGYLVDNNKRLILTEYGQKEAKRLYTHYQFFYQIFITHELSKWEAQYYSLKMISVVDQQFLDKINTYHKKHHIILDQ